MTHPSVIDCSFFVGMSQFSFLILMYITSYLQDTGGLVKYRVTIIRLLYRRRTTATLVEMYDTR